MVLTLFELQMNQSTKSLQYDGAVLNTVMAMAELAHGGQILIDEASFTTVKASLVQLRARVAPSPNLAGLHSLCRQDSCADAAKLAACIMFRPPRQLCLQAIDAKSPVPTCRESPHSQWIEVAGQG